MEILKVYFPLIGLSDEHTSGSENVGKQWEMAAYLKRIGTSSPKKPRKSSRCHLMCPLGAMDVFREVITIGE